jgi:hypothetical protein
MVFFAVHFVLLNDQFPPHSWNATFTHNTNLYVDTVLDFINSNTVY